MVTYRLQCQISSSLVASFLSSPSLSSAASSLFYLALFLSCSSLANPYSLPLSRFLLRPKSSSSFFLASILGWPDHRSLPGCPSVTWMWPSSMIFYLELAAKTVLPCKLRSFICSLCNRGSYLILCCSPAYLYLLIIFFF